ncbi:TVP38/TMEM64 family protein [Glaciecola sp. 2405UD65-10]|uniref:TVP38/TMEM64 family protein n=1 Tax=Glaciecola sp. 2405UD65-10 TaxID=3397244 RepID=UPI003B5AAEBD
MKNINIIKIFAVIAVIGALVAVYFFTPLSEYLKIDKITELTNDVPENALTAIIFLAIFFVGGAILIPVPLMAFTVSLVFNIWISLLICVAGFLLASLSGYGIGRALGTSFFGETVEKHLNKIKDKIDDKGPWAVLALRLAPTPPFTITSIIGGSLKLNFWKYCIGSTLGIAPLALSAVFFGKGALRMMKEPSGLAATSIVAAVILYVVYRVIKKKQTGDDAEEGDSAENLQT